VKEGGIGANNSVRISVGQEHEEREWVDSLFLPEGRSSESGGDRVTSSDGRTISFLEGTP